MCYWCTVVKLGVTHLRRVEFRHVGSVFKLRMGERPGHGEAPKGGKATDVKLLADVADDIREHRLRFRRSGGGAETYFQSGKHAEIAVEGA
jgi:hypothetical protein